MYKKSRILRFKAAIVLAIFFFAYSCKTISLNQTSQTNTVQQVKLGVIGSEKNFILQKGFNSAAIPNYRNPIKLEVVTKLFNKQTYKAFIKAKPLQSANISVNYIDSIANKPKYIQLQIADKVAVVKALNKPENIEVKDYLSHSAYANMLTGISIAFNQKEIDAIIKADAIFLEEIGLKIYALQLFTNGKQTNAIAFNSGVVFEYKTSNCCWQENERHQLYIVDLVATYTNCPNRTYKSANRAKKKINLYKL